MVMILDSTGSSLRKHSENEPIPVVTSARHSFSDAFARRKNVLFDAITCRPLCGSMLYSTFSSLIVTAAMVYWPAVRTVRSMDSRIRHRPLIGGLLHRLTFYQTL